jgi:hypothetical protein
VRLTIAFGSYCDHRATYFGLGASLPFGEVGRHFLNLRNKIHSCKQREVLPRLVGVGRVRCSRERTAVRLGTPPQWVAVAGIDQEDLEPLGLEQLVWLRQLPRAECDRLAATLSQQELRGAQVPKKDLPVVPAPRPGEPDGPLYADPYSGPLQGQRGAPPWKVMPSSCAFLGWRIDGSGEGAYAESVLV